MFFLFRVAFWLTIVLALLPSGGAQQTAQAKVGATDAMIAAGAAVSDMSNFCDRQREACAVGAQAAVAIGQRAQAGAKMLYELVNDRISRDQPSQDQISHEHVSHGGRGGETGSIGKTKAGLGAGPKLAATVRTVPASPDSQTTLKGSDLDPTWRGPIPAATQSVPLPRKAPHRQV